MRAVGQLHVLIGTPREDRLAVVDLARCVLEGGADVVQLRQKEGATRAQIEIARELAAVCRAAGARLIVNDRLDVALAGDAGGVHLGTDDFPVSLARELLGPDRLIGASAGTPHEAREAMWAGADYIGAGPLRATSRKPDAGAPIGLAGIEEIIAAVEIPVIAIGGVSQEDLPDLARIGAHGIAVIQAVSLAPDPEAAARRLRDGWNGALAGRPASTEG
jgi:thiamine-phosphate pyrophosphorylase